MAMIRRRFVGLMTMLVMMLAIVPVTHAGGTVVNLVKHATLGNILVDSAGRTLYRFTPDIINTASTCYDKCAVAWPPLLTDGNPIAGEGVNGALLGVTTRKDGTQQVMYNGMPLYYFDKDVAAGDVKGQNVGKVWFIVKPNTTTVGNQGLSLKAVQNTTLGPILTDGAGRTLYLFTKDSNNATVCYDGCATAWPPLLVGKADVSLVGIGGTLNTIMRNDGNLQVTYNGKPLYYYTPDTNPGDTKGQGVGNVWYVIAPDAATSAAAAAPVAAPTPAALPRTGDGDSAPIGMLAVLALLTIAGGVGMRIRSRK
jgi:predicted lipoprotein with Yx(FWY)xxD motif